MYNIQHHNSSIVESTSAHDKATNIHITCVYRYPNTPLKQFQAHLLRIKAVTTPKQKVIIGDFNINLIPKPQKASKDICQATQAHQLISDPTTKQNTLIDHIYTNLNNTATAKVLKTYYSDHDQIFIQTEKPTTFKST